jgi:hypothetical protein
VEGEIGLKVLTNLTYVLSVLKKSFFYNYLWTYDLYGPAHKDFDAGGWIML